MTDYPAGLTVRPLTTWPGGRNADQVPSQFRATMTNTLEILTRELYYLGAPNPILEVAIPARMFRKDGTPRADAIAEHPGVVLSLPKTDHGGLRYPCDRYDKWQHNLRAIALTLEHLRTIDRYGVTGHGEQYTGFKAIESGSTAAPMSYVAALAALARMAGLPETVPANYVVVDEAYRMAAKRLHPDAGGSAEQFQELQNIMAVIRQTMGKLNG